MPQRYSAVKELRKTQRRRSRNLDIKTDLKKTIKSYVAAINEKQNDADAKLKLVYKKLDKATKRNILEKNTASRRKARFAKMLKSS